MSDTIKKIEEICPLTIVKTYDGKFVIFNCNCDVDYVLEVQKNKYISYKWLTTNVSPLLFGMGNSIREAFKDYKKRQIGTELFIKASLDAYNRHLFK